MSSPARTTSHVSAILGPTNTGKTHFALTRLMAYSSGMIGFPLRLLARENYDKVVRVKGAAQVALITGEEKIIPAGARYYLCTVESMPAGLQGRLSFLAVDEIQLCADPERGHIFTDRLLHARGLQETLFMGSDTIAPLLKRLLPDAEIETRPRFSTLTYTGYKSLSRLPPRTAVVAFSADEVYAIAELLRRERGGAAVVLGSLSPRTRNSQVALYQAGEVEYIVATDAIGMGLNMDVTHVAFAGLSKFDGRAVRRLWPSELAQVAGRAGRFRSDGTFGVTGRAAPIETDVVARLEAHRFEALQRLYWRNSRLRYSSTEALLNDLRVNPPRAGLQRPEPDEDERALEHLAGDPEISALAQGPEAVRLLWEVCQIPDFRKTLSDAHPRLLGEIFRHLRGNKGRLPHDWVASHVKRLDRTEGDIDVLTQRIAGVRTWTYVSHRSDWLDDAGHWQERTRDLEDRLSDALHEQLTLRFVDRRTSILARRLKDRGELLATIGGSGEILVEGHSVGRLEAFRFVSDDTERPRAARAVHAAIARALRGEVERRLSAFEREPDDAFSLLQGGKILWANAPVGHLSAGRTPLHPRVESLPFDLLDSGGVRRVVERLGRWFEGYRRKRLGPLLQAETAELVGAARGLLFQLSLGLGSVPRRAAAPQISALTKADRTALRRLGVRLGRESVYLPALVKLPALELRTVLWNVHHHRGHFLPLQPGALVIDVDPESPSSFYETTGYRVCGPTAVRHDALEKIASAAWARSHAGKGQASFEVDEQLLALGRCTGRQMVHVLRSLGYVPVSAEDEPVRLEFGRRRGSPRAGADRGRRGSEQGSPFLRLRELTRKS